MKYPCGIVLIGVDASNDCVPVVRSFLFSDTVLIPDAFEYRFTLQPGSSLVNPTRIDLAVTTGPCFFRRVLVGSRTCPLGMYAKLAQPNAVCAIGEIIEVTIKCMPELFMVKEAGS